jgi:hypothetical protein
MNLKERDRKRPPEKLYWWDKSRPFAALAAVLFLALMPCFGTEPANLNPALPELLQNVHDLYLDQYPLFAAAFSGAVKLPLKTAYGEELKTNVNLCEPYQHVIVDDSARLIRKVAPLSSERGEQKETINELLLLLRAPGRGQPISGGCSAEAFLRDRSGLAASVLQTSERVGILPTPLSFPDPTTDNKHVLGQ